MLRVGCGHQVARSCHDEDGTKGVDDEAMKTLEGADAGSDGGANHVDAKGVSGGDLLPSIVQKVVQISKDDAGAQGEAIRSSVQVGRVEVGQVDVDGVLHIAKSRLGTVRPTCRIDWDVMPIGLFNDELDICVDGRLDRHHKCRRVVGRPPLNSLVRIVWVAREVDARSWRQSWRKKSSNVGAGS